MLVDEIHVDKESTRNNIVKLMIAHNHTPADLAMLIGISITAVKNYISGKNLPSLQILGVLTKIYNVELHDIVVYKENITHEQFKSENNKKTN